jgi:hypothetical protein
VQEIEKATSRNGLVMKWTFFIFGTIATILGIVLSSDTECIVGSVFLSTYAILNQIDKKVK